MPRKSVSVSTKVRFGPFRSVSVRSGPSRYPLKSVSVPRKSVSVSTKVRSGPSRSVPVSRDTRKTYSLLRNLTSPNKPSEKDYATLVKLLKDHLSPKPLIIAERFRFHKRNQREGETVTQYIAELRKLAEFCFCFVLILV